MGVTKMRVRTLTDKDRQKVLEEALGWLNVPYELHGNDKTGIDCSRFVMAVYQNAIQINLIKCPKTPYLASWLFMALDVIPRERLSLGDLVFYCHKKRNRLRAVTHVAIYISGDRIIHADSRQGKVVIGKIDDYPGNLVKEKDPEIIEQWLRALDKEFPDLTGDLH
jgi:cell wall-associated NlpC family hydrolase